MANIRILRDIKARHGVNANEITRRAYLYVARNQSLPPQVRYQALSSFINEYPVKENLFDFGMKVGVTLK